MIEYAIDEARNLGHKHVGTEHILLGLLRDPMGVAGCVLTNLGLTLEAVRNEVLALLGSDQTGAPVPPLPPPQPPRTALPFADDVRQLLRDAAVVARWCGHKTVCTGYLLLGLVHASGTAAAQGTGTKRARPGGGPARVVRRVPRASSPRLMAHAT